MTGIETKKIINNDCIDNFNKDKIYKYEYNGKVKIILININVN